MHPPFSAMNNHQSLQEILLPQTMFDPAASHDDFLDQILASVPASASSAFPWVDDHAPLQLDDQVLASKLRQHQISSGAAMALMLQQQLLLPRCPAGGLRSPTGADVGLLPMPNAHHNGALDAASFKSANPANDESVKALFNGFNGSLGQTSNHPQPFHHPQPQKFSSAGAAAAPATSQSAASGSSGGGATGQPRPKVRARRGQATDPHSIAERLRRERIAERMKALQELVPNGNKTDKASMLDEIIEYVKFLQLQVKVLSMSRLGGAAGVAPLVAADMSSDQGRNANGGQTPSTSNNDGGMTVTENQVAKLMEEDMGSAMQYLQGKGLCLMPISLATAISTAAAAAAAAAPSQSRKPPADGPTSSSISVLTVQSANGGAEPTSVSKP